MTKPRILVIRGGAIGDFILTLPALKLLREAFPHAHLEVLGYQHIIVLAEDRFYADATRSIEYGAMAGFFVPNGELAKDLAEYFASFQQIVSYLFDPDGIFEANLLRAGAKNILKAYSRIDDAEHATHQLARPLQKLALFLEDSGPSLHLQPQDHAGAERLLGPVATRPVIAIHPGSGSPKKNWPLASWRELGRRFLGSAAKPVFVLVGGEADRAQIAELSTAWGSDAVLVAQDWPLPELAAMFSRCSLFLGHDSGISHLAAAAGAPCLLLFGPTDPAVWAPTNPGVSILEAPGGQLAGLSVDDVWGQVPEALR